MSMDLWNFKDARDLEKITVFLPDSILKEQILLLGEKTNHVLYGKPIFLKLKLEDFEYKMATIFDVVVPALDNYSKTLLVMYSNPEEEYPVAITLGGDIAEEDTFFSPDYTCNSKDEFVKAIKEILSSDQVMKTIQILYSKAYMLAK